MASALTTKHNHQWIFTEGYQDGCPRCAELREAKEANGELTHNHQPNFGRHVEGCPRCTELANGARRREGIYTGTQSDAERSAEIRAHFADPHSTCDHKTCYQW